MSAHLSGMSATVFFLEKHMCGKSAQVFFGGAQVFGEKEQVFFAGAPIRGMRPGVCAEGCALRGRGGAAGTFVVHALACRGWPGWEGRADSVPLRSAAS